MDRLLETHTVRPHVNSLYDVCSLASLLTMSSRCFSFLWAWRGLWACPLVGLSTEFLPKESALKAYGPEGPKGYEDIIQDAHRMRYMYATVCVCVHACVHVCRCVYKYVKTPVCLVL